MSKVTVWEAIDLEYVTEITSSVLEGGVVFNSPGDWTYCGDSEFYFCSETEEGAKLALKIRLEEKIEKYQKVLRGLR